MSVRERPGHEEPGHEELGHEELGHEELGCVTGRFQPVHEQHLELVGTALQRCAHVIVAVTNPDTGARHTEPTSAHRHTAAANPFGYLERAWLLGAALRGAGMGERTTVVPFDLTRPPVWAEYVPLRARQFVRVYSAWEREKADRLAAAGYPLTLLEGDPATKVDAADVRSALASGSGWEVLVPPATVPVLRELLERVPMAERTARPLSAPAPDPSATTGPGRNR